MPPVQVHGDPSACKLPALHCPTQDSHPGVCSPQSKDPHPRVISGRVFHPGGIFRNSTTHLIHVQPHITGVVGPHHVVASRIQQIRKHVAQDGTAQMTHVERFVGIRLRKLHHYLLIQALAPAIAASQLQYRVDHPPGIKRRVKGQVQVAFDSFDFGKPSGMPIWSAIPAAISCAFWGMLPF